MVSERQWVVAIVMVSVGAFLLAVHDRLTAEASDTTWALAVGWLLVLGSTFAVVTLGKRLLLYVPGSYLAATVLSIVFIPLDAISAWT